MQMQLRSLSNLGALRYSRSQRSSLSKPLNHRVASTGRVTEGHEPCPPLLHQGSAFHTPRNRGLTKSSPQLPQARAMKSIGYHPLRYLTLALTLSVVAGFIKPAALAETPATEATSLTEDQLRDSIIGTTIYLSISGYELPIHYKANGRMDGSMGTVAAAFSRGDGSRDSGRWWVEANQLCQRWTSWMEGQTYCYKLTRRGNLITWARHDGVSGTARITD